MTGAFRIKRIYIPPEPDDGCRVLVDRLWPRGVSREKAALDLWLKEVAPSPALCEWFGHAPARFEAFRQRYRHELEADTDAVARLCTLADRGDVTLLYGARDPRVNHAVVLAEFLAGRGYRFRHDD
jgi:uncharacterized protein YeaO (DUF488 family)